MCFGCSFLSFFAFLLDPLCIRVLTALRFWRGRGDGEDEDDDAEEEDDAAGD